MQQYDESKAKARTVYYPNNIGIATPGNKSTYSFLIDGKSENGVELVFVLEEFLRSGARILSHTSWVYESLQEFTLSVTCDLKHSKETSDDFIIKLRGLRFVNNARAISLKRRLFTGSLFPLTMMDTTRVVALIPEAFFRIQDRLKTHAKKSDLVDAGRDVGKEIVRQIREKFEASDKSSVPNLDEIIKDNVIGFMSAAGWGKLRWEQDKNDAQRVLIQDPPTVSYGGTAAGNYFLQGIVAGLSEEFFHRSFTVMEDNYDNEIRLLSLYLLEQELMSAGSVVQDDQLSNQDKAVALREVKKIVQSLENSETALEKTKKEEVSPVAPAVLAGDQIQLGTGSKNDLALKTVEKDVPVLSHSQSGIQTIGDPRTVDVESDACQSQYPLDRREFPRLAETIRIFPLLAKLFPSSNKDKQLTFETSDRATGSSSDSNRERVTHPADTIDVNRTTEIRAGDEKFEEKAITPRSPERTSREAIDEASTRDNPVNRLEGATSPGQGRHVERKTAIVGNEFEDSEKYVFSPSSEDELYYGDSY